MQARCIHHHYASTDAAPFCGALPRAFMKRCVNIVCGTVPVKGLFNSRSSCKGSEHGTAWQAGSDEYESAK